MTILGGVPIIVIMPPRMEANDSGISVSDGLRPAFLAAWRSSGISNASAATLFMTADSVAASPDMMPMCAASLRLESMKYLASSSMTPEFDSPRLTTSTSAMITVAGWPKPENAWSAGTSPNRSAASSATKATRS